MNRDNGQRRFIPAKEKRASPRRAIMSWPPSKRERRRRLIRSQREEKTDEQVREKNNQARQATHVTRC